MNDAIDKISSDNAAKRTAFQAVATRPAVAKASCFHCGEDCPDCSFTSGQKIFCCQGCLVVHDLLAENGLGHFYDLSRHPGVRSGAGAKREQWAFLDEPAVQQRLLDFTDGKLSRVTFRIPAIHCVACVWLLENLFRLRDGVGNSEVNFLKREAAIHFAPERISLGELVTLLVSIGYEPTLTLGELEAKKPRSLRKRLWLQIGVAGFAFGNIMLFSLPAYLGLDSFSGPAFRTLFNWLSLGFALPVLIFSAADYWKSAWLAVRQRILTLEVPIALGLATLYAESVFEVLSGRGGGYLDSLAGLVFFLLCGRVFQQKTHERLAFDRDYKSFFPLSVTRVARPANAPSAAPAEQIVSLSQLAVGDHIVLRNGELIPADSRLLRGAGMIDYSFVTGESAPVAKAEGDYLYTGGKQTGAAIELEIVKRVSQSYLTSLWNHEVFQKDRDHNFNALTNRYSRWFTLAVIGVAALAAFFWLACGNPARAAKAFTSVLIVACPCALALAAPFALGTSQRVLARVGVFLRNPFVLERLAQVDAIVFDKTGTLTAANSTAVSFTGHPLNAAEEQWVYSLARHSTHPLSARLHASLSGKSPAEKVVSFRETPGLGIEGWIGGREIRLGARSWVESHPTSASAMAGHNRHAFSAPGSAVCLSIDGKIRGTFAFAHSLRADLDDLFQKLSPDYQLALLSGDNESERDRFRGLFGSDAFMHFNRNPVDKLNFIRELRAGGRTVMMVGDGLNDAGALQQSDVGLAVVEKMGAFSPASDVIIEAGQVPRLDEILAFSRQTKAIVVLSLGISAAYNLAGISIAAAGILSPLFCAVLMPVSSISVMLFACGAAQWAGRRIKKNAEWPADGNVSSIVPASAASLTPFAVPHSLFPTS